MGLTPADRKWIRRAVREIVREELERDVGVVQIGGYTPVAVEDDEDGARRRIGFNRQVGNDR